MPPPCRGGGEDGCGPSYFGTVSARLYTRPGRAVWGGYKPDGPEHRLHTLYTVFGWTGDWTTLDRTLQACIYRNLPYLPYLNARQMGGAGGGKGWLGLQSRTGPTPNSTNYTATPPQWGRSQSYILHYKYNSECTNIVSTK